MLMFGEVGEAPPTIVFVGDEETKRDITGGDKLALRV